MKSGGEHTGLIPSEPAMYGLYIWAWVLWRSFGLVVIYECLMVVGSLTDYMRNLDYIRRSNYSVGIDSSYYYQPSTYLKMSGNKLWYLNHDTRLRTNVLESISYVVNYKWLILMESDDWSQQEAIEMPPKVPLLDTRDK